MIQSEEKRGFGDIIDRERNNSKHSYQNNIFMKEKNSDSKSVTDLRLGNRQNSNVQQRLKEYED